MRGMALGKRKRERQETLWIPTGQVAKSPSHPFYQRLDGILVEHGFDDFVEKICAKFYAPRMGRPGLAPGLYFRLLLIGYFEGLDSERGIAWRTADSLALRDFLGLTLTEAPPDHSTLSRTRRLIDVETHQEVFSWVLQRMGEAGLLKGKTIGIDATTLEANAALRSIVRRDTGEGYQEFLTRLAKESGIATPRREDLARLDRKRAKKGSNQDWTHPHDPDARITKMKDGRTHLAHKTEQAVDLDTGVVIGVTVQPADRGDTTTVSKTLKAATEQVEAVLPEGEGIQELVADKGYYSRERIVDLERQGLRTYISEPRQRRRRWRGDQAARDAVYSNRRRIRGRRGKALLRQRGERLERPFAHLYETGGMRRTHLRGRNNILKRVLIQVSALNLGFLMRAAMGVGTPRGLQDRTRSLTSALIQSLASAGTTLSISSEFLRLLSWLTFRFMHPAGALSIERQKLTLTTGC
jgi:transposase